MKSYNIPKFCLIVASLFYKECEQFNKTRGVAAVDDRQLQTHIQNKSCTHKLVVVECRANYLMEQK